VLLHNVIVVEQPLSRRPGIDVSLRSFRKPIVYAGENGTGRIESGQERRVAPHPGACCQALTARHFARALGEMLRAKQLTADGAGEQMLAAV
jgi:hypothetical protein